MSIRLSRFGLSLLQRKGLALKEDLPLLVWLSAEQAKREELVLATESGLPKLRPSATDPLVFEIKKQTAVQNPFTMGITVGRAENNDIIFDDPSVSRFHAWFAQDPRTKGWKVCDADSSNHTFVGPLRLESGQPQPVADGTLVRFGDVQARFFMPEGFRQYLAATLQGRAP